VGGRLRRQIAAHELAQTAAARDRRDITVPMGTPSTLATSA